jgi:MoxR-like ATPase
MNPERDKAIVSRMRRLELRIRLLARAVAFFEGRGYVTPQDMKKLAPDVRRHCLSVSHEAKAENIAPQNSIQKILGMLGVCWGAGNLQTKDLI